MTISIERYQRLKRQVEQLQRDADRAEGALTQLMKRLKDEHNCDTIEQAKKLLDKKEKEAQEAEKEYQTALDDFEEDWGEVLDETN